MQVEQIAKRVSSGMFAYEHTKLTRCDLIPILLYGYVIMLVTDEGTIAKRVHTERLM